MNKKDLDYVNGVISELRAKIHNVLEVLEDESLSDSEEEKKQGKKLIV